MDGRKGGWMDGWDGKDGWRGRWRDIWREGGIDEGRRRWMDGWKKWIIIMDGWTDARTDGSMNDMQWMVGGAGEGKGVIDEKSG